MEHVAGGQNGLSVGVQFPFVAFQVAIAANYLLGLWIPYDKLLVAALASVELIDVYLLASTTACLAKCNFA